MSDRKHPAWMYHYPDTRNDKIRELEAENAALKKRVEILGPPKQDSRTTRPARRKRRA